MVMLTRIVLRTPAIKFRKGVAGGGPPKPATAAAAPAAPATARPAAPMSTSVNDFEIPARYRRQPMTQEEIDTINGGGVV